MRESRMEERTYPWDDGMSEGRTREVGCWASDLHMPGIYTTYLRGRGVSTGQKREKKSKQTVSFTCPCFTEERTGAENYVERKTLERS